MGSTWRQQFKCECNNPSHKDPGHGEGDPVVSGGRIVRPLLLFDGTVCAHPSTRFRTYCSSGWLRLKSYGCNIEHAEWPSTTAWRERRGTGIDQARLYPKPIRELLMEVDPRGGPHRRLIPRRAWKPRGRQNSDQYMHFMQLSAECTAQAKLLFCFEESNTRLDSSKACEGD